MISSYYKNGRENPRVSTYSPNHLWGFVNPTKYLRRFSTRKLKNVRHLPNIVFVTIDDVWPTIHLSASDSAIWNHNFTCFEMMILHLKFLRQISLAQSTFSWRFLTFCKGNIWTSSDLVSLGNFMRFGAWIYLSTTI